MADRQVFPSAAPDWKTASDADLLIGAAHEDQKAFAELMTRYHTQV